MNKPKIRLLFRTLKFFSSFLILILGFLITEGGFARAQQGYPVLPNTGKSGAVISMDFKDASLKDVLKAFSIQAGLNFIASQEIEDRTVTLYLEQVSVREAIDSLLKANNLDYEYDQEVKIILVKKAEPRIQTITKLFPLKHAHVYASSIRAEIEDNFQYEDDEDEGEEEEFGITAVIKKLLSEHGLIVEDARTNTLIITDLASRFPVIERAIKELDIPVPQVMLEVEMLDVNKSLIDKLGIDFGENPFTVILPGGFRQADFFIGDLLKRGRSRDYTGSGATADYDYMKGSAVFGSTFAGLLDFLNEQRDTRYLARPRILTLNNETAEIKIETNELIGLKPQFGGEHGDNVTGYETERELTGISLRVTPQINLDTREIIMFIRPKVAESRESTIQPVTPLQGQTDYQDVEERITKSLVKVRDGETVILGGLIHNDRYEVIRKIPLLGDIPFIGALFTHRYKSRDIERELIVFITPHIISDVPALPAEKENSAILSSREQDTSSKEARLLDIEAALKNFNLNR